MDKKLIIGHPFEWVVTSQQKWVFAFSSLLAVGLMVSLTILGRPLQTEFAPVGIVSFEFAGTMAQVHAILDSWEATAKVYAGLNLGLDYLFLLAYGSAIGLGCGLLGQRWAAKNRFWATLGTFLAWGMLVAALLDGVENAALIYLLLGGVSAGVPAIAQGCATVKFLLIIVSLLYLISAGTLNLVANLKQT